MEQARIKRTIEITLMLLAGVGIAYLAEKDTLVFLICCLVFFLWRISLTFLFVNLVTTKIN